MAISDRIRKKVRRLYHVTVSTRAVAEIIPVEISQRSVWRICSNAGIITTRKYPRWLEIRAQELVDMGYTLRDISLYLDAEFPAGGPSPQWVSEHTTGGREPTYEHQGKRSFMFSGREIEIRGKHSVEDCKAALEEYADNQVVGEILDRYEIPETTFYQLTRRAGLERTNSEALINYWVQEFGKPSAIYRRRMIPQLYEEEEYSVTELAELFGVSTSTISEDMNRADVERRDRSEARILCNWDSLRQYARFCRDAYISVQIKGRTQVSVAKRWDVSDDTVARAIDYWKENREDCRSRLKTLQSQ